MQIHRVTSLLQAITDVRRWLLEHIPLTDSMLGYDLFLRIANDFTAGRPLVMTAMLDELPHARAQIIQQIRKMVDADLLTDAGDGILQPTAKFVITLRDYSAKFESVFILRKGLRDQQLVVVSADPALRDLAESLYDHMYDLGWLYLHNFGAACFLMASLVKRVAESYGYKARLASCHAEIAHGEKRFLLGAQGYAGPGQIDGHAVCIVDDKMVLDFGLGSVRRAYRRDFPWAMAYDYAPNGPVFGALQLACGETVTWKDDWQSPGSAAEFQRYEPAVVDLFKQYESYYR